MCEEINPFTEFDISWGTPAAAKKIVAPGVADREPDYFHWMFHWREPKSVVETLMVLHVKNVTAWGLHNTSDIKNECNPRDTPPNTQNHIFNQAVV